MARPPGTRRLLPIAALIALTACPRLDPMQRQQKVKAYQKSDYYADGMPFNIAFIGDLWTEPQLIGYAHDLEQATKVRRPPTLIMRLPDTER